MSHLLHLRRTLPLTCWYGLFFMCLFVMLGNGSVAHWPGVMLGLLGMVVVTFPLLRAFTRVTADALAEGQRIGEQAMLDELEPRLSERYDKGIRDGRERAVSGLLELRRLDASEVDEAYHRLLSDVFGVKEG